MLTSDDRLHEMRQRDEGKMDFLKHGEFLSHSGITLRYKVECDALSDATWECFASEIARATKSLGGITEVHGIPSGGMKLANALGRYATEGGRIVAIVDDVLTTGRSMEEKKKKLIEDGVEPGDIYGFVLVRRSQDWTNWIYPFFYVSSIFKD
jgi:hypothetical protein